MNEREERRIRFDDCPCGSGETGWTLKDNPRVMVCAYCKEDRLRYPIEPVAQASDEGIATASGGAELQLEVAVNRFRDRCAAFGVSSQMAEKAIERARADWARAYEVLESPIERRLLAWLMFEDYTSELFAGAPAAVHVEGDALLPKSSVIVSPQMKFGRFRLDFLVTARIRGSLRHVAVECDGAEYHDAAKDAERDAYFLSWGIPTVRAGGQELYRAPQAVSAKVADIIIAWTDEGKR
ncbi:hypothetical protein [Enterovirga sp. CN4-39]|uniref:hypothetical protein n=1 Tax=Enterovirga sp. CN4-39 TaxID=3400910 RepID=UPI003C010761